MRPAPAVAVTGNGGAGWRALRAGLPALAAAVLVAFVLLHLQLPAWPAVPAGVAVGLFAWRAARPRPLALRWDGQVWTADGVAGRLAVMIDLGPALLLRLRPEPHAATRWIAVTQNEAGSAWHALRAALYSRPSKTNAPRVLPTERADF
jgi:hypothetical protein